MFGRRSKKSRAVSYSRHFSNTQIEGLESRTLLSGSTLYPDIVYAATSAATNAAGTIAGFTPAQIKKAYGFDKINLSGGAPADGAGQTIAIIDAYNDPNIAADLSVFDSQFGLQAPGSLKVVNQSGGSSLPSTDAGWAGEISLDVEWAHAIAPAANILLVEAKAADTSNLLAAVDYARHVAGVSVVSMSWGGSEFFSWGSGAESSSQTNYDPIFTTPAGHQGVTFVASAGDSGVYSGVQWPASSPNVLSVGGTTLTTDSQGNYVSEQSWSGTNGGYSQVEVQPSYQKNVQNSGARSVPDVAYNADPNTGYAVYDSVSYQGNTGWQEVGGTSAGAPQWSALVAIIDQSRAIAGKGSLDGVTELLPDLYALYSAPSTTGYTSYTQDFNDIVDATYSSPWQWWWGSFSNGSQAVAGYDAITGLGTPHANALLTALTASGASTGGTGSTGSTGTGGTTTTPAALPDSPIVPTFDSTLPTAVVSGSSGSVKVDLTNTSSTLFTGPITITLYATAGTTLGSTDSPFATLTIYRVKLKAGAVKTFRIKFTYPAGIASGSYNIIAQANATGTNTNPITALSPAAVSISPATVDLSTSFHGSALTVNPGHNGTATVIISNQGNVAAVGTFTLSLFASDNTVLDSTATLISHTITRAINLKPGRTITLHVRFAAPLNRVAGSYNVIASTSASTKVADANGANDTAIISTVA